MSDASLQRPGPAPRAVTAEGPLARALLIGVAAAFLVFFVLLPLGVVFVEALRGGWAMGLGVTSSGGTSSSSRSRFRPT